jgi:hypothetical protein
MNAGMDAGIAPEMDAEIDAEIDVDESTRGSINPHTSQTADESTRK